MSPCHAVVKLLYLFGVVVFQIFRNGRGMMVRSRNRKQYSHAIIGGLQAFTYIYMSTCNPLACVQVPIPLLTKMV